MKYLILLPAVLLLIASCAAMPARPSVKTAKTQKTGPVEAEKAYDLYTGNKDNPSFVIIDVRTEKEYAEGHIPGSLNIDFKSPGFSNTMATFDRGKTYLLYCATSRRSEQAVSMLRDLGFLEAYHIFGGLDEWIRKGYPVVR